jgi:hypothetical protein
MANGEIGGPPAVDFYGMLSGLGDTIRANAKQRQQEQINDARKEAFSSFTALDPNSPDYGRQAIGVAQRLGSVGDQDGALKFLTLAQTAADRAHTFQREGVQDQHWNQSFKLQERAADRADDPTPTGFVRNGDKAVPLVGGPADPAYLGAVAKARAEAEAQVGGGKPIEFQTLGGSKFLVKQPGGGYTVVDPSTIGQPGPPVLSTPKVVGDAEGVATGLYDPPKAPGQRPPVQVADAQPSTFAGRFQGQPAQPVQAPQQPIDVAAVDPQTGRRENWLKSQPGDVQAYIKKIADYEIDPRTTSIKGGHREQVLSAVAQYDPTYNQNDFGSRAKAIRDFATGSQGNSVRSFDVAIDHLDLLKHYTKALDSGDIRAVNAIRNRWLEETGSPLPTNLQAVAPIVGAEVSKAVIGSNNALADREELRKPLLSANSVPQITGAIEAYQGLMAGQLKGLKKQYEDTTGKKNFDTRVRETTRNILLKPPPGTSESSDSSKPNVTSTGVKWSIQ